MNGKIRNTAAEAKEYPGAVLAEFMIKGSEASILGQEARGQKELVESTSLPTQGSDHPAWEKMGVTFGPPDPSDPLFRPATLPEGWKKVPAPDHSMWSYLHDEKGRERASIFYKAAFYDRGAYMRLTSRFHVGCEYDEQTYEQTHTTVVDTGRVVHSVAIEDQPGTSRWEKADAARSRCQAWLKEHYPEWEDPSAYWD